MTSIEGECPVCGCMIPLGKRGRITMHLDRDYDTCRGKGLRPVTKIMAAIHVSADVSPETIKALGEMLQGVYDNFDAIALAGKETK